jgi:meckelin
VLLPPLDDLNEFHAWIFVAAGCKIVEVLYATYKQCNVDLFFIDWEKPKVRGNANQPAAVVSIWRTLFMANEWNELQTIRLIHFEFTLMFLIALLRGAGWEYVATPQPNQKDLTVAETHDILRFWISATLWMSIALGQVIYFRLIVHRFFDDPAGTYVDLLSLSNLSLIVLDQRYHGYYLHGRSVHCNADTSMGELIKQLQSEQDGRVSKRGMLANSDEQVFEVFVTKAFRQKFDQIRMQLPDHMQKRVPVSQQGQTVRTQAEKRKDPTGLTQQHVQAQAELVAHIAQFVDDMVSKHTMQIQAHSLQERLLRTPPDMSTSSTARMYTDQTLMWQELIMLGNEAKLLLFDLLVYTIFDQTIKDTLWSILLTYVVDKVLLGLRRKWSSENIAKKTLVDDRFLL